MIDWGFQPSLGGSDEAPRELDNRAARVFVKNEDRHFKLAKDLEDLCGVPAPGEQWLIVTEKAFNAYACIKSLLETRTIDEMYLAVYRINAPTVTALSRLIAGGAIKKAGFIISTFFRDSHRAETWANALTRFCDEHPDVARYAWRVNHAKVLIAKCGDDYFVFEGSGNLSDNARIEQYRYENNKAVYDFHKSWMTAHIDKP